MVKGWENLNAKCFDFKKGILHSTLNSVHHLQLNYGQKVYHILLFILQFTYFRSAVRILRFVTHS
jgi:hypothetical protein